MRGPGLVDLQLNGFAGFDFNSDPAEWSAADFLGVARALRRRGVVVALPTLITSAPERMLARARRYAGLLREAPELQSTFPKLHIEGPFLCPQDGPRGAHPARHCATPAALPELFDRLREASGDRIGILTLAPELPGALQLVSAAASAGTVVAIGHTAADGPTLRAAVDAGARMSTHLGNGTHPLLPRHDNYLQWQLAEDRLAASFITDGHHLPWFALQNFLRAKSTARSILVTDATAAAGAPPGRYRVGEAVIESSHEGVVRIPGQLNLAGSSLTLDRAVLNVARHCAVPFEEAWAMASTRPAELIGLAAPPAISGRVSEEGFLAD